MSLIALIATSVSAYAVSSRNFALGRVRPRLLEHLDAGHLAASAGRRRSARPARSRSASLASTLERLRARRRADDPVVGAVPVAQVAGDRRRDHRVVVDGQDRRLAQRDRPPGGSVLPATSEALPSVPTVGRTNRVAQPTSHQTVAAGTGAGVRSASSAATSGSRSYGRQSRRRIQAVYAAGSRSRAVRRAVPAPDHRLDAELGQHHDEVGEARPGRAVAGRGSAATAARWRPAGARR